MRRARGESEELGANSSPAPRSRGVRGPLLPRGTLWTLNGAHAAPCFPHPVLVPPWAGGSVKAFEAGAAESGLYSDSNSPAGPAEFCITRSHLFPQLRCNSTDLTVML